MTNKNQEKLKTGLPIDSLNEVDIQDNPSEADVAKEALAKKKQVEDAEAKAKAEMMAEVKAQILSELASEKEQKRFELQEERKKNAAERAKYVKEMKASNEPWVDVEGLITDGQGVGIELDWNDAFIDFLRAEGITGTDEDQIIQKYVTLLLRDMADQIDEQNEDKSQYEG